MGECLECRSSSFAELSQFADSIPNIPAPESIRAATIGGTSEPMAWMKGVLVRSPEVVVISDLHLGTDQSMVGDLRRYLDEIQPQTLVLNGDIFDMTHHNPRSWRDDHYQVISRILELAAGGCEVIYVTGNHDYLLRKYSVLQLGGIRLVDEWQIERDGKRYLITHGDCFDSATCTWRWLHTTGGKLYQGILVLNNIFNNLRRWCGAEPVSLARLIKRYVVGQRFAQRYRQAACAHAADGDWDGILCGHIHVPEDVQMWVETSVGESRCIHYLNSGDWVEHATACEYAAGNWCIHEARSSRAQQAVPSSDVPSLLNNQPAAALSTKGSVPRLVAMSEEIPQELRA